MESVDDMVERLRGDTAFVIDHTNLTEHLDETEVIKMAQTDFLLMDDYSIEEWRYEITTYGFNKYLDTIKQLAWRVDEEGVAYREYEIVDFAEMNGIESEIVHLGKIPRENTP